MDSDTLRRTLYVALVASFIVASLVTPIVRLRLRTGVWGVTFRRYEEPIHRLVSLSMSLLFGGLLLWTGLHAALGPERLGVWPMPLWFTWTSFGVCAVGLSVVAMGQIHMGSSWRIGIDEQRTELVTGGLFGVVRNPIFSGMLLALAGFAAASPSPWTLMGWLVALLLVSLQVRLEEQHLLKLHGEAYLAYASRVGRLLPGVGLMRPPPQEPSLELEPG